METRSAVVWLTALAAFAAPMLRAQDAQPLAPGTRVRVTSESKLVGKLVSTSAESLVLDVAGCDQTVPRSAVRRFEVSARPSRKGKGALIGACIGAVPGTPGHTLRLALERLLRREWLRCRRSHLGNGPRCCARRSLSARGHSP